MNILDKIAAVLQMENVKKGFLPDKPDSIIGLFEYQATPPDQSFGITDIVQNIQVRVRDQTASTAYATAETIVAALNRYHDGEISVLQSTPILDIGRDDGNPSRQEYTVNFEIRRY